MSYKNKRGCCVFCVFLSKYVLMILWLFIKRIFFGKKIYIKNIIIRFFFIKLKKWLILKLKK